MLVGKLLSIDNKNSGMRHSGYFRNMLERAGLDKAVIFTLLTRAWQAAAGGVSLLLIASYFAPETQGYYYTFSSLLSLQAFVELGLNLVIVNLVSREWSKLSLASSGAVIGSDSALCRLAGITHFIAKWYAGICVLFLLGVGVAGYVFFSQSHPADANWKAPWIAVVVLATAQLWLMPMLSILEGCNQVVELSRFRLVQTAVEAFVMWFLVVVGAGLWAAVGSLAVRVTVTFCFLVRNYRNFFRTLQMATPGLIRIRWREEIWPMQWRIALQGIVNQFALSLFNPVMFHYYGPKVAGQMGMTLQIISVAHLMAMAWVQTKVPQFGMLAASRNFVQLDRLWLRASSLSFGFAVLGSILVWIAVVLLEGLNTELAARILSPLPIGLFLIANTMQQITNYQAAYLRAYGREPFLAVGVLGGLFMGGLVFVLGSKYGPIGAALAFFMTICFVVVPSSTFIWLRRRREWQV